MAYGTIDVTRLRRGLYSINAGYFSRALTEACQSVPGVWFRPEIARGWIGYVDAIQCVVDLLAAKGIKVGGDTLPKPDAWRDGALTLLTATKSCDGRELRPYQIEGVKFAVSRMNEGCILADSMRLGKSAQATVAARAFNDKTLIVCPPQAAGVWGRAPDHDKPGEIAKWWPDAWRGLDGAAPRTEDGGGVVILESVAPEKWQKVFLDLSEIPVEKRSEEQKARLAEASAKLDEFAAPLRNAKVVVVHDGIVYAWVEVLRRWGFGTFIFDEIHQGSSYRARRTIAAKALSEMAVRRLGLSGTPMLNRVRDLHSAVDIVCPGRFGIFFNPEKPHGTFGLTFCGSAQKTIGQGPEAKTVWEHNGRSNVELLKKRLSYFMLRRTAKEVDEQLPAIQREMIDVKVPASKAIMPTSGDILKGRKYIRKLFDLAADGKYPDVLEILRGDIAAGEKGVVFCHRRKFAEALVEDLSAECETALVYGGMSHKEIDARIAKAEKAAGPFLFICTIEACGQSIDLSFGTIVTFAEVTYEGWELAQAERRIYKFGSGRKQYIRYIIARGTGEELAYKAVVSKLKDFEDVIGETGDGMRADLDDMPRGQEALNALADTLMGRAPVGRSHAGRVARRGRP